MKVTGVSTQSDAANPTFADEFVLVRDVQNGAFVTGFADDLQADGHVVAVEPAGHTRDRQAVVVGKRGGFGGDPLLRVRRCYCDGWNSRVQGREHDDIDICKGFSGNAGTVGLDGSHAALAGIAKRHGSITCVVPSVPKGGHGLVKCMFDLCIRGEVIAHADSHLCVGRGNRRRRNRRRGQPAHSARAPYPRRCESSPRRAPSSG